MNPEDFKTPVDYEALNLDTLLNQMKAAGKKITAENIDDLLEDGIIDANKLKRNNGLFTTDIQIYKDYPAIIFNPKVAGDTDWWISVLNDLDGTDTDNLAFGTGTVPGTNTKITFEHDGNLIVEDGNVYVDDGYIYMNLTTGQGIAWKRTDNTVQSAYLYSSYASNAFTLGLSFVYQTTNPATSVTAWRLSAGGTYGNSLAVVPGGNCDFQMGVIPTGVVYTKFWTTGGSNGSIGIYSNCYMYYSRSFYLGRTPTEIYEFFRLSWDDGDFSPYKLFFKIGNDVPANGISLRFFAGHEDPRFIIKYDGELIVPKWTIAGMVKNLADGSLVSGGTFLNTVATKTADYAITSADGIIVCNSVTPITVTLPAATGIGQAYTVKNINTGTVTIEGNLAETIEGDLNVVIYQWESAQLVDYGTGTWAII